MNRITGRKGIIEADLLEQVEGFDSKEVRLLAEEMARRSVVLQAYAEELDRAQAERN